MAVIVQYFTNSCCEGLLAFELTVGSDWMRLCITLCNVRQVVGRGKGRVQFSFSVISYFFFS